MSLHLIAALIVAVVLAGTHWKAYKMGERGVQAEWDSAKAVQVQDALARSEANRMRERALSLTNEGVQRDFLAEKRRLAGAAAVAGERVRELESALSASGAGGAGAAAGPRADDTRATVIRECAAALTALDEHAQRVGATLAGLQGYTGKVCLGRP